MAGDVLRELRAIREQLKVTSDALKSSGQVGGGVRSTSAARNRQSISASSRFATREAMLRVALPALNAQRPEATIAGMQRVLNATPDVPDLRDRVYQPVLSDLKMRKDAPQGLCVLDQGQEGACTGFALAAAINLLNVQRLRQPNPPPLPREVSPRMLYEMAKLHDEWLGENYSGSSLRGAMKGFFHNGVCSLAAAPYNTADRNWTLTVAQAKDARQVALGAYYRLQPDATHYHAALNEVDVICVSARVHSGWKSPRQGWIEQQRDYIGGHAFAIVGYDEAGFLVHNSWGPTWGGGGPHAYPPGVAHWSYDDWSENVLDAWVMRLSVPTPKAFHLVRNRSTFGIQAETAAAAAKTSAPRRDQVVGHIVNIDDGLLQTNGNYPTPMASLIETADRIGRPQPGQQRFNHVMIYAHGGLNSLEDGAARAAALREPLKRNGIYPLFFLWGTDFPNEFQDAIVGGFGRIEERAGAGFSDFTDLAIEKIVGKVGRAVWRAIKHDADVAFNSAYLTKGGGNALAALTTMLGRIPTAAQGGPKLHLVGHSAGGILLGRMLSGLAASGLPHAIDTVQLLAPACTVPFFDQHYRPLLGKPGATGVRQLTVFNLTDQREQDDNVLKTYQKSLLYLVSRALEEETPAPLLGMKTASATIDLPPGSSFFYAGQDAATNAANHGDFDNDFATMTSVVTTILGRLADPGKALEPTDLTGY